MFFSSIKEINRLLKEANRLLNVKESQIYLLFWGAPTHADITEFSVLVAT